MKANCVLCWCPADTPGSVLRYSFWNMWSMWLFQRKLLTLRCKTAWVQLCLCISWLIDIVIDVCYLIWWYLLHLITHYGLLWLKCFLVVRVQPCLMGGVWQPQAWPYLFFVFSRWLCFSLLFQEVGGRGWDLVRDAALLSRLCSRVNKSDLQDPLTLFDTAAN